MHIKKLPNTYENMDQKISDFHIGTHLPSMQSIDDLIQDFEDAGGRASSRDVGVRTFELKHALDGTAGRGAQYLGPENLKAWAESNRKA